MALTSITPTVGSVSTFATTPKVVISWTAATPDAGWVDWRVYRRVTGTVPWTLQAIVTPSSLKTWDDWTVPSNVSVEYAVTQTTATDESAKIATTGVVPNSPDYWLIVPDEPTMNVRLYNVHADEFEDDVEVTAVNLLGRGRRVEHGDDFGVTGTLEVSFFDQTGLTARAQMLAVKALHHAGSDVYLRNPFGDVWAVHPAGVSVSRMAGVGQKEYSTASIPYSQVTA